MKYHEVHESGMPVWLYSLKEEDRLKFDFEKVNDGIKVSLPFKYKLEFAIKRWRSRLGL